MFANFSKISWVIFLLSAKSVRVFSLFKKMGSIDYARKTAIEYNKKAKNSLSVLKDSEAKELLCDLADYSIKREK